jgi:hypothetical protein
MNDHDRYLQLIAGRELGELDAAESAELDDHLAGCATCSAETTHLADVAAEIAFAAPVRRPPEGMRASILTAIHADATAGTVTVPAAPHPAAAMEPRSARPSDGWLAWLRGPRLRLASVGLVGILVVGSVGIGARVLDLQSQLDAQARSVAATQQRLALQAAAMAVILDPKHLAAGLEAEPVAPSAVAEVVYRPGTDQAYVIAAGLPATTAGHVYQLWYADATGVHPLSTSAFDGDGMFVAPFRIDLGGKTAAMVTLESAGGSTGQPGPQVVFGELPPG